MRDRKIELANDPAFQAAVQEGIRAKMVSIKKLQALINSEKQATQKRIDKRRKANKVARKQRKKSV